MKRGLNMNDLNTLRGGLQSGWSVERIERECHTSPGVVQKYIDSLPEETVAGWKAQAPATGVSLEDLKAQIMAEMREDELSPQQRGAITRKARAMAEEDDAA